VRDHLADGSLVSALPGYQASHVEFDNGIYAVFQHGTQVPSKVRVFVDYIAAYFKERLAEPPRRPEPVMALAAAG
jgi:DNA-binding transcriptional LysR family regulator